MRSPAHSLKSLRGSANVGRRQHVGDEPLVAQPVDEALRGVRCRFVHEHGPTVLRERVGVGVGLNQGGAVTEVAVGVPQCGQDEVQLLAVVRPTPQRRGGLDEEHLAVGVLAAVCGRTQLVGEEPQRGVVSHGHDTRVPTGCGWDCDVTLR